MEGQAKVIHKSMTTYIKDLSICGFWIPGANPPWILRDGCICILRVSKRERVGDRDLFNVWKLPRSGVHEAQRFNPKRSSVRHIIIKISKKKKRILKASRKKKKDSLHTRESWYGYEQISQQTSFWPR